MSKFALSICSFLALAAASLSPAAAQEVLTRKGQVPLVGSDQASRDAKPIVAGSAIAGSPQMAAKLAAPAAGDAFIQGLSAIKHGRNGKDSVIDLTPQTQMMLKSPIMTPKPFKGGGGKLVQVNNSRVSPYAAMGIVASGCSGALVMKRFVLTMPWCVYDSKAKKFYDNLDFTPAVNGSDAPVGTVKWKNVWIAKGYQDGGDLAYAYALIELDEDIGDKVGWFGFGPVKGSENVKQLTLSGYPFSNVPENTVWETKCSIDSNEDNAYFYRCPGDGKTIVSMSGAPLYMTGNKPDDAAQLLGLHASSQNDKQDSFWAMKLNDVTTKTLLAWANNGNPPPETPPDNTDQGTGDQGNGDGGTTTPQCTCDQGDN